MPRPARTVRQLADAFLLRFFNGCTDALSIHRCFRFMLNSDIAWTTLYGTFLSGENFIGSLVFFDWVISPCISWLLTAPLWKDVAPQIVPLDAVNPPADEPTV
jgi:hypothetical protein